MTVPACRSRFSEKMRFENLGAAATAELISRRLAHSRMVVVDDDSGGLTNLAEQLVTSNNFANGRDVEAWARMAYEQVSRDAAGSLPRRGHSTARPMAVSLQQLEAALNAMLASRTGPDLSKVATGNLNKRLASWIENALTLAKGQQAVQGPLQVTSKHAVQEQQPVSDETQAVAATSSTAVMVDRYEEDARKASELADEELEIVEEVDGEEQGKCLASQLVTNPFGRVDGLALRWLQDFLQERGLNSEAGAAWLAGLLPDHSEYLKLAEEMAAALGWSAEEARDQLSQWQVAQKGMQKELEREKTAGRTMQAIWRCAVCGQARSLG